MSTLIKGDSIYELNDETGAISSIGNVRKMVVEAMPIDASSISFSLKEISYNGSALNDNGKVAIMVYHEEVLLNEFEEDCISGQANFDLSFPHQGKFMVYAGLSSITCQMAEKEVIISG